MLSLEVPQSFTLSSAQQRRLREWLVGEAYPAGIEKQKTEHADERSPEAAISFRAAWDDGVPYYGTAGGGLTFEFRPHGLGVSVRVTEHASGLSISLTEQGSW